MIRPARPADLPAITAIYNEAIAEGGFTGDLDPLTLEDRRTWLAGFEAPFGVFVKEVEGTVAGYAALAPYRRGRRAFAGTCELSYYLGSRHRGAGLGRDLVAHALAAADAGGFATVLAIILACNPRSINLLMKFGFAVSGRLPAVATIQGEHVDHVYLSRRLVPAREHPE